MDAPSRVARWSLRLGVAALALFALGPLSIQVGVASAFVGFRIFGVGLLLALAGLVLGLVGLWRTRPASARSGRQQALRGTGLAALLLGAVGVTSGSALSLPPITDITTDPDDPPGFEAVAALAANRGRDLSYPGAEFAAAQHGAYADLAPIQLGLDPDRCFAETRRAAESLGWEIVADEPAAGRIEATQTTRLFRFVDDVVIRVRPAEGGCRVDLRSKSRDGRGDLGANAARIRAFRRAVTR